MDYNYAFIHENGICYGIHQNSDELTDTSNKIIDIPEYNERYLNALWTGSEWNYPPSQEHFWNGSEWVSVPFSNESSLSPEDSKIIREVSNTVLQEYRNAGSNLEDPAVEAMAVEESKRRFKEQTGREFQM